MSWGTELWVSRVKFMMGEGEIFVITSRGNVKSSFCTSSNGHKQYFINHERTGRIFRILRNWNIREKLRNCLTPVSHSHRNVALINAEKDLWLTGRHDWNIWLEGKDLILWRRVQNDQKKLIEMKWFSSVGLFLTPATLNAMAYNYIKMLRRNCVMKIGQDSKF